MLRVGLLINPYAGIGGPMALKGSDDIDIAQCAAEQRVSEQRAQVAIERLRDYQSSMAWLAAPSIMGEQVLTNSGFEVTVVGQIDSHSTSAADTERLAIALVEHGVDVLLFVGGDGTARNMVNALSSQEKYSQQLVLGIPAGVKMHSGVYTVSPQAAVSVLELLIQKEPVSTALQEVRDIDEQALREGKLNSRYYGELLVPNDQRYVQQVKNTARQNEEEIQLEIAASIVDDMDHETLYIIGCGTTPQAVMDELGLPNTLLGVDVVMGRELLAMDVTEQALQRLLEQHPFHSVEIIVTAIGGQGHIIGRGNQQISSAILRRAGRQNLRALITPSKLAELDHRSLLMDSGDPELDRDWAGLLTVHIGYQQTVSYRLNEYE